MMRGSFLDSSAVDVHDMWFPSEMNGFAVELTHVHQSRISITRGNSNCIEEQDAVMFKNLIRIVMMRNF